MTLLVGFCGEEHRLEPGRSLEFGRMAELEIDDNPYLHRVVGEFEHRDGWWWLRNRGRSTALTVRDLTSRSQVVLTPGRDLALSFPAAAVQFEAGKHRYEVDVAVDDLEPTDDDHAAGGTPSADGATIGIADLPLTADQRRLIVVLAEPALRDPADARLPTNREAALRLGWSITRFNRKLDNVCGRLHKAGVSGLRGGLDAVATDRRSRLVEHALGSGLVTAGDLTLLEGPGGD